MRVEHVSCGPFVNASERQAFEHLDRKLRSELGDGRFVLFTNVAHAVSSGGQADEIDILAVGPTGVHVIEVKHWDRNFLKNQRWTVEHETGKLANKARKIATRARQVCPEVGYIAPKMLLTKEPKTLQRNTDKPVGGVSFFALADWHALLGMNAQGKIPETSINALCEKLVPRSRATLTGEVQKLGRIADMRLISLPDERFHRVYRGRDVLNQDRLVVHLYDLSASEHANPEHLARREFDVIQRLQKSPWLPRLVDSFQDVPNYPGELYFFSVADTEAPSITELQAEPTWQLEDRVVLARNALVALDELHAPPEDDQSGVVHRTIVPDDIRVRPGDKPLFFDWQWAKLPEHSTVSGTSTADLDSNYTAPEVLDGGLANADRRADVYSLCASLLILFEGDDCALAKEAALILSQGVSKNPETRPNLRDLAAELEAALTPPIPEIEHRSESSPNPRMWAEDTIISVADGHNYRVVGQLGTGGIGRTFKMQQIKLLNGDIVDEYGTYVAKVVLNEEMGDAALRSYMQARPNTKHPNLALLYWTAADWKPNQVIALLEWIQGTPLGDYKGVLELYAEELGESDLDALLLGWLKNLCSALAQFHEVGFVHGDVSPSNIIINGSDVRLIDYDLVTRIGEVAAGTGTPPYAPPNLRERRPVELADDLFALAATFFEVLFDRDPFLFGGVRKHNNGLAWQEGDQALFPGLAAFFDRAVSPNAAGRFPNALAGEAFIAELIAGSAETEEKIPRPPFQYDKPIPLTPNEVPWLLEILQTYPGSRYGNTETRGLDTEFAEKTYVTTELDKLLSREIQEGQASLVILCGNAGDGKTAFLQHLASELGLPHFPSSERVWEAHLENGIKVKANLDGAAAWRDRSADDLLDEIFEPFHQGDPPLRIAHLVAVNDGRLMEWLEHFETRNGNTRLTDHLVEALEEGSSRLDPHIRFIELNRRSLVGGIDSQRNSISTKFLDEILNQLIGGAGAVDIWQPCQTCSAQYRCIARNSSRLLGTSDRNEDLRKGALIRERLTLALQAVHQRNEVHITTRELKATLSYVLFGTRYCADLHANPNHEQEASWDLLFDPDSSLRQGEVLRELTLFDPALDAHPRIDRYLLGRGGPHPEHGTPRYPDLSVSSARRRAYLEWSDTQIEAVGGTKDALRLANSEHFLSFRDFPILNTDDRAEICKKICKGISRLEELPPLAFDRSEIVPIRIIPRTPTETTFWVEKPVELFSLSPEKFPTNSGLETLHRHLILSYEGQGHENLIIPFSLYELLLQLSQGAQLIDTSSDDIFANLSVFNQRLAQENERNLLAWNPMHENKIYTLSVNLKDVVQLVELT